MIQEADLDRLVDRAYDAGVALRVHTDLEGEATFRVAGLGVFDDLPQVERALVDAARHP